MAIRVDGCFDMAPFGAGDDDLSATQDPNPCPVETAWKGSDVRDVVVDTTAPTPTALVTDPDGASGTCALGGGDEGDDHRGGSVRRGDGSADVHVRR